MHDMKEKKGVQLFKRRVSASAGLNYFASQYTGTKDKHSRLCTQCQTNQTGKSVTLLVLLTIRQVMRVLTQMENSVTVMENRM
jgi:hypothetical protein